MSLSLETIDNSFLLFVRSKEVVQLDNNLNSNLKIDLQAGITRNNALQDIHIQLNSCEIPHSFYNFSSNLNNINLFLDGSSSLVLTELHYDIYELIAYGHKGKGYNVTPPKRGKYSEIEIEVIVLLLQI